MSEITLKELIINKCNNEISDDLKLNINEVFLFNDERGYNILFATKDKQIYSFGENFAGGCGLGHNNTVQSLELIPELCGKQFNQICFGFGFVLVLTDDNHVYGWGRNEMCQLGRGYASEIDQYLKPGLIRLPSENGKVVQISAGYATSFALTQLGIVYGWGRHSRGQIGCGFIRLLFLSSNVEKPLKVNYLSAKKVVSIWSISSKSFALINDGTIYSWGYNYWCELGHDIMRYSHIYKPRLIDISNVKSICGSSSATYFLTEDNRIHFCGLIRREKSGEEFQLKPKLIETDLRFQSIHSVYDQKKYVSFAFGLAHDGKIYSLDPTELTWIKFNNLSELNFKLLCSEDDYHLKKLDDLGMENRAKNLFLVLRKIGSGGFGSVYNIRSSESYFALKMISIQAATRPNERINRVNRYNSSFMTIFTNFLNNTSIRFQNSQVLAFINRISGGQSYNQTSQIEMKQAESLLQEVNALKQLRSDFVVYCRNAWIEDNYLCIQMEKCSDNFENILKLKPKAFNRNQKKQMTGIEYFVSSEMFKEILESLQFLHNQNPPIVHMDLKPQNILINEMPRNGRFLKIADFGLSITGSKKQGNCRGTFPYFAPEVSQGHMTVKSDIYSLFKIAEEIFNIDINDSNEEPEDDLKHGDRYLINDELLKQKQNQLKPLIIEMSDGRPNKRPSADQILSAYKDWALDSNELTQFPETNRIVESLKNFENKIFYFYYKEKV